MIKNELNTWTKEMGGCHLGRGIACTIVQMYSSRKIASLSPVSVGRLEPNFSGCLAPSCKTAFCLEDMRNFTFSSG